MKVRLYTIPGSHPGVATQLMLKRKGIEFSRVDLIPVVSKPVLRLLGFGGVTVPAVKIDGRRFQGSIEIANELERLRPDPPLYPADRTVRLEVEAIEDFADVGLQHPIRQALWWGFKRNRAALASYAQGARMGVPVGLAVKTGAPIVALAVHFNEASDENVRAGLSRLPALLDRIDAWIEEGMLDGETLNVGDFQVAASLRLAMTMDDLRPAIEGRPAGRLALRVLPEYAGRMPPVLPAEWLAPLLATAASR